VSKEMDRYSGMGLAIEVAKNAKVAASHWRRLKFKLAFMYISD